MIYKIIACYDTAIEAFMPPQAVNDMLDEDIVESNRRAVIMGTIPADKAKRLILYKIGTFNDKDGSLIADNVKLANLADFVPQPKIIVEERKDVKDA